MRKDVAEKLGWPIAAAALAAFSLLFHKLDSARMIETAAERLYARAQEAERSADPVTRARLWPVMMRLEFIIVAAGKGYLSSRVWFFRTLFRELDSAERELWLVLSGRDPFEVRKTGVFLRCFESDIDAGNEPYSLRVPESYDPGRSWPLIVSLHGHGGDSPLQGHPAPRMGEAVVLSPHARGSIDFMGPAETELLRAIREVRSLLNIDPERVYLTGYSMGGTGSWHVATHYPDFFAGIAPLAGNADHEVWSRIWQKDEPPPSPIRELRRRMEDADSPSSYAANLLNVPVYVYHAAGDEVVPVGHSDSMVERLRSLGAEVEYVRPSVGGHWTGRFDPALDPTRWLLARKRRARPERVLLRSFRLRHARAYWVRVCAFEKACEFMRVEARASGDEITVSTSNVMSLSVDVPASPLDAEKLALSIDGTVFSEGREAAHYSRADGKWVRSEGPVFRGKKAGLEGPCEEAFLGPFLVVCGTTGDESVRRILRMEAMRFSDEWETRFGRPPRLADDSRPEEIIRERANLVVFGGEEHNRVSRLLAPHFPLRIREGEVSLVGRTLSGKALGLRFCFPQDGRLVVVTDAAGWEGYYQSSNRFGNWFDWAAYENRWWYDFAVWDSATVSPETFLAVGFFDGDWKVSPAFSWFGSPEFRQKSPGWPSPRRIGRAKGSLVEFVPKSVRQRKGPAGCCRSPEGDILRLLDEKVDGLGVRAPSEITYELAPGAKAFCARVGSDWGGGLSEMRLAHERVVFRVLDEAGKVLAESPEMGVGDGPVELRADVSGATEITLVAEPAGRYLWHFRTQTWAEPSVE